MNLWVYADDRTNRVRVHMDMCSWCNDGRGIKGSRLPDNRWLGAFATEQLAVVKALETGRRDAKGCWFCLRGLGGLGNEDSFAV